MEIKINNTIIRLMVGDITDLDCDAIVNPANDRLILGGGVAGAIRRRGGASIQEQCDRIGGTFVGGAVITGGGNLKARYVIHAVGPVNGEGDEDHKLKNATLNTLKLADEHELKTIAFPAISTGIFGFPRKRCADIMLKTVKDYIMGTSQQDRVKTTRLTEIIFCLYDRETYNIFAESA